jgi:hypothetical protein
MGPFAHVSEVRRDPLLRQLAGATREQARTWERAPGSCIGGGRRALAVLLFGRRLRRILVEHLGDHLLRAPLHRAWRGSDAE